MPNFCRHCGRPINPQARFCSNCGLDSYLQPLTRQALVPTQQNGSMIRREKSRKPLLISLIAIVTVACLVIGLVVIPPQIQAYRLEKFVANESNENFAVEVAVSGQPAFSVTPVNGITVSGEANALDRKRRFKAKLMTEQELFDYSETNATDEYVHLAGFSLDADMKENERFDHPVTLTIDLEQLGIPESIFQNSKLTLSHVRADDVSEEIPCQVVDGMMTAQISSNNIFIIKGVTAGAVAIHGILASRKFFNIILNHDTVFRYFYLGENFKIYWPASLPPADPNEINRVEQRLSALYSSYDIDMKEGFECGINALSVKRSGGWDAAKYKKNLIEKINKDPEYQACMDILNDSAWIRKYFLPEKVAVMVECLELAEEYLFEENRGFRRPGHVIDVLVAGDGGIAWPDQHGRDSLGAAVNEISLNPYLHLNAKQLIIDAPGESGREQAVISTDNMLLTTVHEIFHIVQSGYVTIDYKDRRWFSEATAVTLEMEAFDYFTSTGWIETPEDSISFTPRTDYYMGYYSSYANQQYWISGERSFDDFDMHYGYAAADFLEFIRDNHYSGFSIRFLPELLMHYSYSSDVSGYAAIVSLLGGAPANVSKAYRAFFEQPRPEIYRSMYKHVVNSKGIYAALFKNQIVAMSAEKPVLDIKTSYLPLSLTPHALNITLPSDRKAMLLTELGSDAMQNSDWFKLFACFDTEGINKKAADRQGYTVLGELNQSGSVMLYEECSNTSLPSGGLNALGGYYTVLLLVQPEQPIVAFTDEKITLNVPGKSAAVKAGHVKQYQYTIVEPDGTVYQYRVPVEKSKYVVRFDDVNFDTTESGATFKFYYTEMVSKGLDGKEFIFGPDGVPAEYSINMPTGTFIGSAEWATVTEEGDQVVYFADMIEPFYVYVKVLDDDKLRISAGRNESDAEIREQVCVYDEEYGLYKFYDWVDDRYACYEFTFSQNLVGENIVEGYIYFYEKEEHVNSMFAPLESFKILATETTN